jgi:hypothetical protein
VGGGIRRPVVRPLEVALLGGSLVLGLVVAAATAELPLPVVGAGAALVAGVGLLGPELIIALALLAAANLIPFVDTTAFVLPGIKVYFLSSGWRC